MDINKKKASPKSAIGMFFSGVFVLTLANILVKAVGLISKIVLNRVVGSVGAGYYSSAYEIYAYLYVISTSGLPVALSIMVSKSRARGRIKEAKKIFDIAFIVLLVIGTVFSLAMIVFSDKIATVIGASDTRLCIIMVAPTMLFICLSSCMRGYFQGYQLMMPTAISQLIEALIKVGLGVLLALWAKSKGYNDYVVAAYTILGVTIGVLLGMIYLYIKKLVFKENDFIPQNLEIDNEKKSRKQIFKELFSIAIPITLSSSVLSLTTIIDTVMVQNRLLAYGMNELSVRIYYGDYTSLVISMFNLPTILFYPIANALVPLISLAHGENNKKKSREIRDLSLRIINIIAIPCAVGLGVFSYPILNLLMFKEDSVSRAAPWLSIAAISVMFLGIISVTNAFLNTAGKQKLPIISMIVGAFAKLVSNYFLLGKIGILGAPISTVICYLFASSLNIYFTVKHFGKLPSLKRSFALPMLSSIISIGLSAVIYIGMLSVLPQKLSTLIAILLSVIFYVVVSFKLKSITIDDIAMLPNSEKLIKVLSKSKFFKKLVQNR
ncbi:MAG: polysaccharide biosynthesis protein [Clostridia bacterium]|nr:polysaccharide biosynthesis protein [Clostridia bacterium]